jgi:hypothetical protein
MEQEVLEEELSTLAGTKNPERQLLLQRRDWVLPRLPIVVPILRLLLQLISSLFVAAAALTFPAAPFEPLPQGKAFPSSF